MRLTKQRRAAVGHLLSDDGVVHRFRSIIFTVTKSKLTLNVKVKIDSQSVSVKNPQSKCGRERATTMSQVYLRSATKKFTVNTCECDR